MIMIIINCKIVRKEKKTNKYKIKKIKMKKQIKN